MRHRLVYRYTVPTAGRAGRVRVRLAQFLAMCRGYQGLHLTWLWLARFAVYVFIGITVREP